VAGSQKQKPSHLRESSEPRKRHYSLFTRFYNSCRHSTWKPTTGRQRHSVLCRIPDLLVWTHRSLRHNISSKRKCINHSRLWHHRRKQRHRVLRPRQPFGIKSIRQRGDPFEQYFSQTVPKHLNFNCEELYQPPEGISEAEWKLFFFVVKEYWSEYSDSAFKVEDTIVSRR